MNKLKSFCLVLSAIPWFLFGQSTFYMSNQTIDDCEGFFFDSDNGLVPLDYGHNEDLTFSICPLGADTITMVFNDFCTEINNDVLRFFDGPDTFSSPIGLSFSGQIQI